MYDEEYLTLALTVALALALTLTLTLTRYDEEYVPGGEKDRPALVSSAEDRTAALAEAEALCVA